VAHPAEGHGITALWPGSPNRERLLAQRRARLSDAAYLRSLVRLDPTCANRSKVGTMPVNLSIKDAPDRVVQRLREGAGHYRSLQGELLAIIEAAVQEDGPATGSGCIRQARPLP
jgi:hypothetical protein